ncbi:MAG: putative toxin-antitoxin system toxin component, PIN family [Anaerolinea sp.]|nr:putative toxin-antitoxin system toxin component, PIN family [Anaerolinea sp.]
MNVIVDTNVLVSAVLRDRVPETVILHIVAQPDMVWVVSPEIMTEYKEVLARNRFGLPHDLLQRWYQLLDEMTTSYTVQWAVDFPRDQKDAKFLACALVTEADFLITGDHDFAEAQKLVKTIILSVSQFKNLVIGSRL